MIYDRRHQFTPEYSCRDGAFFPCQGLPVPLRRLLSLENVILFAGLYLVTGPLEPQGDHDAMQTLRKGRGAPKPRISPRIIDPRLFRRENFFIR